MPLEPIDPKELNLGEKIGHLPPEQGPEQSPLAEAEKIAPRESAAPEKDAAYDRILSQVQTQSAPAPAADVSADARKVSERTDAESQITHLVEIAVQSGVPHAVKVARHLEDNYILDTFHDRLLSEELHQALLQKGLIKDF